MGCRQRGSTKRRGKKRPIHRFPKPVDKERESDATVAALQLFACGRCERTSCSLICELCLDSMPAWKVEEERETCVPVILGEKVIQVIMRFRDGLDTKIMFKLDPLQ